MVKLQPEFLLDTTEMREAYCDALIECADADSRIVTLDCDLQASMGTKRFSEAFPDRSINVGIQEANACGMAAGLSAAGMIPFFHSFAVFTSRRIYDQLFLSCAYADLNVKFIGGDAGVCASVNGGTHMSFEDIGILRNIPGITIIDATDSVMIRAVTKLMASHYGVDYMRMPRKQSAKIYEDGTDFKFGKANILVDGNDVTIIASGIMVNEALKASQILRADDISARVIDIVTIKPIDCKCIIESAVKTGAIVTAENHSVVNGLGCSVSAVLSENIPVPQEYVGVKDLFGEVGSQDYLMKRFELTSDTIVKKAKVAMQRKTK